MRTTYKLSQEGLQEIEQKRRLKGWGRTSRKWANMAMTSESTLKRFLRGEAISPDHFISLCQAIGIPDWQRLAGLERDDRNSTRVPTNPNENNSSHTQATHARYGITVTGVFTEDQKLQVETILEALRNLLLTSQVVIKSKNDVDRSNEINT